MSGGPASSADPLVTVVVPTQDRADLLGHTLASVAAQTQRDFECIVVDDGSRDRTGELVAGVRAEDPRFRYVRQEPSSAANARNRGLALARGRLVTFLDSDDLFEPDKLAWQCAALENEPRATLVYGDTFQFSGGDPSHGGVYLAGWPRPAGRAFEALLACSSIYSPTVRTSSMRAVGGFDKTLASAEDWDAWLALARDGLVVYERRVALRYRIHPGNKSADKLRNYRCARRVASKHLAALPWPRRPLVAARVRRYFARVYGPALLQHAYELTAARRWEEARPLWRALTGLSPRLLSRRGPLAHAAWAALPLRAEPPWAASRMGPQESAREAHEITGGTD